MANRPMPATCLFTRQANSAARLTTVTVTIVITFTVKKVQCQR